MKVQRGAVQANHQLIVGVVGTTEKLTFTRAESQIRFIRQEHSAQVTLHNHVAQSFLMLIQLRSDVPVVIIIIHSIQYVLLFWIEG